MPDDETRQFCGEQLCSSATAGRGPSGPSLLDAPPAPADGRLLVLLGESPFRIAVADGWCHDYQQLPVCSLLVEMAREDTKTAPPWLREGRGDPACATTERAACEALCSATTACWSHETYYCTAPLPDGTAVTVVYAHSGFGVAAEGPWFHHGEQRSAVAKASNSLLEQAEQEPEQPDGERPDQRLRQCAEWQPPRGDGGTDALAAAQHALVGDFVAALPAALGFTHIDALVVGAGYWDLARMRSAKETNVQSLDDPHYMSGWLAQWSRNATRLLSVLQEATAAAGGSSHPVASRLAYMTAALSPTVEPQKDSGSKLFGVTAGSSSKPARSATPDDFFYGERIAQLNAAGREVVSQMPGVELVDWEWSPFIIGSDATEGLPWSTQMQDFLHPTPEAGTIMIEHTLRHLGWVDPSLPLPFERPRADEPGSGGASLRTEILWLACFFGGLYLLRICSAAHYSGNDEQSLASRRQTTKTTRRAARGARAFDVRAALRGAESKRLGKPLRQPPP
jgi:hypothetical protein